MLKTISIDVVAREQSNWALDDETIKQAAEIVAQVQSGGLESLRKLAIKLDGRRPDEPLVYDRLECERALAVLDPSIRQLFERVVERIRTFATAQLGSIQPVDIAIPGGRAGHTIHPLQSAGCYVPGGRYPLVSSLFMTAVTARVAGVRDVWVACPAPSPIMLAAAGLAGVDGFLAVGGAQAIAAMAHGVDRIPKCDVIVGPGNRWVTAAKQIVSAQTKIDMLAGPSELLIVADDSADPAIVAADLLAQAEHDPDARPMLIATSSAIVDRVNNELQKQLLLLPTANIASVALKNGFAVVVGQLANAMELCEQIAPEHLELQVADAATWAKQITRCGALFIGNSAAEVIGDYGAGPNHVLPTGGTARFASGLSVDTFLRRQTWLQIDDPISAGALLADTISLSQIENLSGHELSAARRKENWEFGVRKRE